MSCPYLHYNMDREPSSSSAHLFEPSRARLSEHNDGRATSLISSDEQANPSRIFAHSWIAVIVFTAFNIGPADFQPRNIPWGFFVICAVHSHRVLKWVCPKFAFEPQFWNHACSCHSTILKRVAPPGRQEAA